ncbi:MAG TPA: DUF305 domain-containing protein [Allosphingosinicella sp.]|jgi:uncharacterized protein (DUF305 family)
MSNASSARIAGLAVALILSACGQGAPNPEQGGDKGIHDASHGEGGAAPSGTDMHGSMASAVGADVSDTWLRKMIAHHEGAIAMTGPVIALGGDPRVVAIARRMAAKQRQEIEEMRRLVRKDAAPDPESARPYAAGEKRMQEAMAAAEGGDASQTFLRRMIPHHRSAIAMSEIVLAQGRDERVAAIARRIVADQGKEIAEIETILKASAPAS